jgi:hypothetical protein
MHVRKSHADAFTRRIPIILLFCVGGFVVVITIIRIPMILSQSVSQSARSLVSRSKRHPSITTSTLERLNVRNQWASIEILGACIVANTAFFYAIFKDMHRGHNSRATNSAPTAVPNSFYMQTIPSNPGTDRDLEEADLGYTASHDRYRSINVPGPG